MTTTTQTDLAKHAAKVRANADAAKAANESANESANEAANELANVQAFVADTGAPTKTSATREPKEITIQLPKGTRETAQTLITPLINGKERWFDFKHIRSKTKNADGTYTITILDNNCSYVAMVRKK